MQPDTVSSTDHSVIHRSPLSHKNTSLFMKIYKGNKGFPVTGEKLKTTYLRADISFDRLLEWPKTFK